MFSAPPTLSKIIRANERRLIQAAVDIAPSISFATLISAARDFCGVELRSTDRFDEYPAVIGERERHEIVVFGLSRDEAVEVQSARAFQLTITPCDASDESPRDASLAVCQFFTSRGLHCEPTPFDPPSEASVA